MILLSCGLCVAATAQQQALTVGTATAVTGQTVTGFIEVSAGSDVGMNIPVAGTISSELPVISASEVYTSNRDP